jgi:hypothetical protein
MLASPLRHILFLYIGLAAVEITFLVTAFAATAAVGGRMRSAAFGTLRVRTFRAAGVEMRLGVLPVLSWVLPAGMGLLDSDDGPGSWRRISLPGRLSVVLAPWAVIMTVAVLCLGMDRAAASFVRAPAQIVGVDSTLVRGFFRVVGAEPFSVTLGVMCAKMSAFNLLPLPNLSGGLALREIVTTVRPSDESQDQAWARVRAVSMIVVAAYLLGRLAWALLS